MPTGHLLSVLSCITCSQCRHESVVLASHELKTEQKRITDPKENEKYLGGGGAGGVKAESNSDSVPDNVSLGSQEHVRTNMLAFPEPNTHL